MKKPYSDLRFFAFCKRTIGGLLLWLFATKVEGREYMPESGAVIVCTNHLSMADVVIVGAGFNRPVHYLAKSELFKVPLLGPLIKSLGAIPIHRGKGDTAAIRSAEAVLQLGRAFCIFPEGHRSKDLQLGRGKAGVGLIMRQTGAPVIPAAIICKKRPGLFRKTIIRFGPMLTAADFGEFNMEKRDYQACADMIMERIAALKNAPPPTSR